MCNLNDYMQYRNVLSKTYMIPKDKSEVVFEDFFAVAINLEAGIDGLPFYYIEPLKEDWVYMRMHVALDSALPNPPEGFHFDSYFYMENMASLSFYGDVASQTGAAFEKLGTRLEENNLTPTTPVFIIMRGDETLKYAILKVGYANRLEAEIGGETS